MTIYAPTDVRAVTVPTSFDGCGQPHEAGDLEPGQRWGLDCPACETALSKPPLSSHGWAHQIDKVALTPDERALLETQEKEGSAATAMMVRQLGDTLAAAMRQGYAGAAMLPAPAPAAPSIDTIQDALKQMPAEDLANLLKIAGLAPVEAAAPAELPPSQANPDLITTIEAAPAKAVKKAAAAAPKAS